MDLSHIEHLGIAVKSIQEALPFFEGVQLIDKHPRRGAEGLNIGFLHPKSTHGLLLELCDGKDK